MIIGTLIPEIYRKDKQFVKPLERAVKIMESGLKVGADNLELMLTDKDKEKLGAMVDILNQCEIEYKEGKPKKLQNLIKAIEDYKNGDKMQLRTVFAQYIQLRDAMLKKNPTDIFYSKIGLLNTLESWSKAQCYV